MRAYNYTCKKCSDHREYFVQGPQADPLECSHCGEIGALERDAVQGFNIGASSASKAAKSPSNISPHEQAILEGGKQISKSLEIVPLCGNLALSIEQTRYLMPNPSRN